jgi:D-methionine transport system ATP-binding protein
MIRIEGLKKSFDDLCVLDDINLKIDKGDIYGLVGKSGAGKSTLLRCINGLEKYDSGSLLVDGIEVSSLDKSKLRSFQKDMGMIFQNFALLDRRTVYQNVALPMKVWKVDKKEIDNRVKELLDLVGIPEKIAEKPSVLSGGQKQRVAIARALALNPKILLCDEATSALDPKTTQSILALLRDINEKLGLTIVVVTHQMSVVRQICNKVSILENGKIEETGLVSKMFLQQPPAFRKFLGSSGMNLPADGINIRLLLPAEISQTAILSSVIRELNMDIPIVAGQMEKYRDEVLGSFVINVPTEKADLVKSVLQKKGIVWQIETMSEIKDWEVAEND